MIRDSAGALLQILDDILNYSKIEANKLTIDNEPFDVRKSCDLVLGLPSARAHEKGLQLRCHVAGKVAAVLRGDNGRLRQIPFNLLGNAIKFTSAGSVSLFVALDSEDKDDQLLRIQVIDTGIGMDTSRIQSLFSSLVQAESTTSRRYGGTGLGLAISSRLVKLMGGTLALSSELGTETWLQAAAIHATARAKAAGYRRTTVDIRISINPLSTRGLRAVCRSAAGDFEQAESIVEALPKFARPERTREEAVREGALILIAEDNPVSRHLIEKQLNMIGYVCDAFEDSEKAFAAWLSDAYAILIIDCHMPVLGGYGLATRVREHEQQRGGTPAKRRTPIVGLTASVEAGELDRCIASGMDDCMVKPAQLDSLQACLQRWAPRCLASPLPEDAASTKPPPSAGDDMQLPPLNWEAICGTQSGAGRDETLVDVLGKSLRDDAQALQDLMRTPDPEQLRQWIHRVEGAAMFLRFSPLAKAIDAFRNEVLAGDPPTIRQDPALLEHALSTVLAKLERISGHLATQ